MQIVAKQKKDLVIAQVTTTSEEIPTAILQSVEIPKFVNNLLFDLD
jgi:hypothetical protein